MTVTKHICCSATNGEQYNYTAGVVPESRFVTIQSLLIVKWRKDHVKGKKSNQCLEFDSNKDLLLIMMQSFQD